MFSLLLVGYNVQATEVDRGMDTEEVKVCCESYGVGSMGVKTPSTYSVVPKDKCLVVIPGGGRNIVNESFCKVNNTSNTPVISGVKGPQTLNIGQKGEWEIKASSPMGGSLTYEVIWGDEEAQASATNSTPVKQVFQQKSSFTHIYKKAGTYNPKFTVKSENTIRCVTAPCPSNAGNASTSMSVLVNNSTNVCPLILLNCDKGYSQVNSGKDSNGCDTYTCKKVEQTNVCPKDCICNDKGVKLACPDPIEEPKEDKSCLPGYKFSPKTGEVCPVLNTIAECMPGYKFNPMTGAICPLIKEIKKEDKIEDKKVCTEPGSNCGVSLQKNTIKKILKNGSIGDEVKKLQAILNLAQDGFFGPETKQKLIEWQTKQGLKPDGVLGPKSLERIEVEIEE